MKKIILFTLIFCYNYVFPQENIDVQKVVVIDNFVPEVPDSEKINFFKNFSDTIIIENEFKYILFDNHLKFSNEDINISSVRIKGHPVEKMHNSYIKGGSLLNNLSPHISFYYNSYSTKYL